MKTALERLPDAFRRWQPRPVPRHFRVLLTTGPLFITACKREHGPTRGERVLSLDEYGRGASSRSFVKHIPGGSWEQWDSRLLNFAYEYWPVMASTGLGAAMLSLME
jgi:hypothetical protein